MRTVPRLIPLTLAASLLSCQDGQSPTSTDPSSPSETKPLAEVTRTRFFHDAGFIHTIPESNVTFTIGIVTPLSDLAFCGGSVEEFESDLRGTNQVVTTPRAPST